MWPGVETRQAVALVRTETRVIAVRGARVKVCSHLTFAFAFVSKFASTSPSVNIALMETQTQTHRMGSDPFCAFVFAFPLTQC